MKKISLKEMKGALTRKEMKNIVAGGSLSQIYPHGSCSITFRTSCRGGEYPAGLTMCININTEPMVQGCDYYTNWCDSPGTCPP